VVTNIKVVDQIRGARVEVTTGCDSAELVFGMGYLCEIRRRR
jgi:hypothetical protein